ncbi:MAG: OmpA family protein [Balneolales bacterium]
MHLFSSHTMYRRIFYLFIVLLFSGCEARAQNRVSGGGMQFGGAYGQTGLSDDDYNLYTRGFIRQEFSLAIEGELSLGLGIINGTEYKSRLVPMEYRIHYKPYKGRKLWVFDRFDFDPFLFAGLGALHYTPIAVNAADDPLTGEVGPSLPGSTYWNFKKGITAFIPLGAGVEMGLDGRNKVVITAGYNQSLSNSFTGVGSGFINGFWGLTAGIKINRQRKRIPPSPALPYQFSAHVPPVINAPKPKAPEITYEALDLISGISLDDILFHTLSAELRSDYHASLQRILQILEKDKSIRLKIYGHTDNLGTDMLNQSLSEERAWTVAFYFIQKGISPERIETIGFGSYQPLADNSTVEGRARNRRIEIDAHREVQLNRQLPEITKRISAKPPVSVLMRNRDVWFNWSTNNLMNHAMDEVITLAATLQDHPDWEILIVCNADTRKGQELQNFLSLARAERIRRELIKFGISHSRLHTAKFDKVPDDYDQLIPQIREQSTVIIRTR